MLVEAMFVKITIESDSASFRAVEPGRFARGVNST
jgi:hypothetical protein